MGICTSCYSGSNATNATTVKLILLNGELKEYSSPVKVFVVLNYLTNDVSSFICNADNMDFDDYVTAMSGEEELCPGQIYFELPISWLKRRLTVEDMASLAVKAGTAVMVNSGKVRCGCLVKQVDPFVFCDDNDDDEVMLSDWRRVGGGDIGNHRGHGGSGGKKGLFTRLQRIVEE